MKTCWLIILLVCCSSWVVAQSDFYATDEIQTIEIEFEQSNWRVLLDSLKANNAEARLEATVHINGQKFNRAGIRFKGNSSYNSALRDGLIKLPFNIKLDYFDRSANYQGYQTIKLANGFRDPSMVREVLAYEIAREYMAAPKANFAKVYVNDAYYGLYTNTESIDRSFLKEHFGDKNGAFFKCDPDYHAEPLPDCRADQKSDLTYHGNDSICYLDNYERKSNNISDWNNLIRLTRRLNHHPKKLEDILDIDAALKMLAFNNLIVNLDSYTGRLCHNYYLYQDSSGRFQPIIWDLNLAFGAFRYAGTAKVLSDEEMAELPVFLHASNPNRPLISKLLADGTYRDRYLLFYQTMLQDFFYNDRYLERGKALQALIDADYEADENKLYGFEQFHRNLEWSTKAGKTQIVGIQSLMRKRVTYLQSLPIWGE